MKAVVARLVWRRFKRPVQAVGLSATVLMLMGLSPLRPRDHRERPRPVGPVTTEGVVRSLVNYSLGPKFDGTVQTVPVKEGQPVHKGDLLFAMDATGLRAELAAARERAANERAALASVRAERSRDLSGLVSMIAEVASALRHERQQAAALAAPVRPVVVQPVQPADGDQTQDETLGQPVDQSLFDQAAAQQRAMERAACQARAHDLAVQIQALKAQLAARQSQWAPMVQSAAASCSEADKEVRRVQDLLNSATRRSPISGVVTKVFAEAGEGVGAGSPVIRVDDPKSYHVVALVDEKEREAVQPGTVLTVQKPDAAVPAAVKKIDRGWDQNVFEYYVWLKPQSPDGLSPDQPVQVTLPPMEQSASAQ